MKIVRLGNTESHLLLISFILRYGNEPNKTKKQLSKILQSFVNWLYTTAGYYDKTVPGTKFNFDQRAFNHNFFKFINHLEISVGNAEASQIYLGNNMNGLFDKYKNAFIKKYNISNLERLNGIRFFDRKQKIFNFMKNKKILVISSFDGLIKKQFESGNVYKIFEHFPKIKSLKTYKFPYCFLNNGPHSNYHETLEVVFNEIKNLDFDLVLLGCGCYGHMLCHKIDSELKKDAIYLGGAIQTIFGILSQREKQDTNLPVNEFWVTEIPKEYRPSNFKDIEGGCYW